MVDPIGTPTRFCYIVALAAIGGKIGLLVVGIGRSLKVAPVAVDAIVPDPIKLKGGGGCVALVTRHCLVYACQWETVLDMEVGHIVHHPIGSGMTAGAIGAHGLLVHVQMARKALRLGLRKNQTFVAAPAIHGGVPTGQREYRFAVPEKGGIHWDGDARCFGCFGFCKFGLFPKSSVDLPARRSVAGRTVDLQIGTVRVLRAQVGGKNQE